MNTKNLKWYSCSDCPGYSINKLGNVRSDKTNRVLVPHISNGYVKVTVFLEGKRYFKFLHRLIAKTFVKGYKPGLEVNHIDGDKTNNHINNLEWVTRAQNIKHSVEMGLQGKRKLTMKQIRNIRQMYADGRMQKDIAIMYGLDSGNISRIVNNKRYVIETIQ